MTGVSETIATKHLEAHHWNLNVAVNAYLSQHQDPTPRAPPAALVKIWDRYCDPENPSVILVDGTLAYLADLDLAPEDPQSLTLAYLLKAPLMGEFAKADFLQYWTDAAAVTLQAMREQLESAHDSVSSDQAQFDSLYAWCFDFVRGSDTRIKALAAEDAVAYWELLWLLRAELVPCAERIRQWLQYVGSTNTPVSRDLWLMAYRFFVQVVAPDPEAISAYDEMSLWPSAVDAYMVWLYEHQLLDHDPSSY